MLAHMAKNGRPYCGTRRHPIALCDDVNAATCPRCVRRHTTAQDIARAKAAAATWTHQPASAALITTIAANAARLRAAAARPCTRCGITIRSLDHPFNTCRNTAACERRHAARQATGQQEPRS